MGKAKGGARRRVGRRRRPGDSDPASPNGSQTVITGARAVGGVAVRRRRYRQREGTATLTVSGGECAPLSQPTNFSTSLKSSGASVSSRQSDRVMVGDPYGNTFRATMAGRALRVLRRIPTAKTPEGNLCPNTIPLPHRLVKRSRPAWFGSWPEFETAESWLWISDLLCRSWHSLKCYHLGALRRRLRPVRYRRSWRTPGCVALFASSLSSQRFGPRWLMALGTWPTFIGHRGEAMRLKVPRPSVSGRAGVIASSTQVSQRTCPLRSR